MIRNFAYIVVAVLLVGGQAGWSQVINVDMNNVYSYAPHSGVRDFQIRFDTSLNELDLCG